METDLSIRFHAYSTTAAAQTPADTRLYADALESSGAAAAAASAAIICSHTRELPDDLDFPAPDKPAGEADPQSVLLPLRPANATIEDLALGAAGIPAIRNQNG